MKRFEQILIIIVAALFVLQLIPFEHKGSIFAIATWILALSYLIGGYWLFNARESRKYFLPIVAGISFAISLVTLPLLLRLNQDQLLLYFPILNGLLFIVLLIHLLRNRKTGNVTNETRKIFIRSAIIFFACAFFTYTPNSFRPYRQILRALNIGYDPLVNNIDMVDFTDDFDVAIDKGDCDKAIEYGLEANKAGKKWLGIDEEKEVVDTTSKLLQEIFSDSIKLSPEIKNALKNFTNQNSLSRISRTYTNLYKGYKCKAENELEKKQFSDALNNFLTAHKYLTTCEQQSKYWEEEKSWSLSNIGLCYRNMNKFSVADSFYFMALENYQKVKDTADAGLAKICSNYAFVLGEEKQFKYSNELFQTSNSILRRDSSDNENRKNLVWNYGRLSKNYLEQDSLQAALFFVKRALIFSKKNEEGFCTTNLIHGICLYKLNEFIEADKILRESLLCFAKDLGNEMAYADCNLVLAYVNIALAKYTDARMFVNKGIQIISKYIDTNSPKYATYLVVLANLNKITGDYKTSEEQYNKVIQIFTSHTESVLNLPTALAGLSGLDIILSKYKEAKSNSDSSISIASRIVELNYPRSTELLNSAGYIDYCIGLYKSSGTLYKKVIGINENYDLNSEASTAIALNGLGLVNTANKNYKKADSLFAESLRLHKKIFSDNNPMTAIVYLNIGNLCINESKLSEAEENLNKAMTIDKQFFNSDHDVFADIYVAMGDLERRKGQGMVAKEDYQKALDIYRNKFDDDHQKVISTRSKIR